MTTFDEREKGFESKYKRDRELAFKAQARRNKLLGLWAAEQMGLDADTAAAYAKEVVQADFDEPGDDDVLRKVLADLEAKSVDIDAFRLRKKMNALMLDAQDQVRKEG